MGRGRFYSFVKSDPSVHTPLRYDPVDPSLSQQGEPSHILFSDCIIFRDGLFLHPQAITSPFGLLSRQRCFSKFPPSAKGREDNVIGSVLPP